MTHHTTVVFVNKLTGEKTPAPMPELLYAEVVIPEEVDYFTPNEPDESSVVRFKTVDGKVIVPPMPTLPLGETVPGEVVFPEEPKLFSWEHEQNPDPVPVTSQQQPPPPPSQQQPPSPQQQPVQQQRGARPPPQPEDDGPLEVGIQRIQETRERLRQTLRPGPRGKGVLPRPGVIPKLRKRFGRQ